MELKDRVNDWRERFARYQTLIEDEGTFEEAISLFLELHGEVHHSGLSFTDFSFTDELLKNLDNEAFRMIPQHGEHSIAWCLWHIARIEDITMNTLMMGDDEVFYREEWDARIGEIPHDTANEVTVADVEALSWKVNYDNLINYRNRVGLSTREQVVKLRFEDLGSPVDPTRLNHVVTSGSISPRATSVIEFWGSLTTGGLLQTPGSRHNLSHLVEALRIKQQLGESSDRPDSSVD